MRFQGIIAYSRFREIAICVSVLVPAETFTGMDHEAILFVEEPLHAGVLSIAGVDGFGLPISLEHDAVRRGNAFVSIRAVERLNHYPIMIAAFRQFQVGSLGTNPLAQPLVGNVIPLKL